MSNRDALRRLSRKVPAPEEIEKITTDLWDADAMSAAIIAGALVELELERLISSKFAVTTPDLVGQIFLNRGPLADFHSKILLAHAFGYTTSPMAAELHSLKAIRNAFAHARSPITFEHEVVAREVASLAMIKAMKDATAGPDFGFTNQGCYLVVIRVLLIMFYEVKKHGGSANDALNEVFGRFDESGA